MSNQKTNKHYSFILINEKKYNITIIFVLLISFLVVLPIILNKNYNIFFPIIIASSISIISFLLSFILYIPENFEANVSNNQIFLKSLKTNKETIIKLEDVTSVKYTLYGKLPCVLFLLNNKDKIKLIQMKNDSFVEFKDYLLKEFKNEVN